MAIAAAALAVVATVGAVATFFTLRAYRLRNLNSARQPKPISLSRRRSSTACSRAPPTIAITVGDLQQAETLADDASKFYEELLKHSDDPDLRFRAAECSKRRGPHLGAHRSARKGGHRSATGGRTAAATYDERSRIEPKYSPPSPQTTTSIGLVDWALDRPIAAEPSWRQAWEIWTELAERFPQEPSYRDGVARMLANLGCVCYFTDRFDEAEEYYQTLRGNQRASARRDEELGARAGEPGRLAHQPGRNGPPARPVRSGTGAA